MDVYVASVGSVRKYVRLVVIEASSREIVVGRGMMKEKRESFEYGGSLNEAVYEVDLPFC